MPKIACVGDIEVVAGEHAVVQKSIIPSRIAARSCVGASVTRELFSSMPGGLDFWCMNIATEIEKGSFGGELRLDRLHSKN